MDAGIWRWPQGAPLDAMRRASHTLSMPSTYLLFDFGINEEAAQQARHKLEGWKQAFRLDKKLLFKIERGEAPGEAASSAQPTEGPKGKAKSKVQKKDKPKPEPKQSEAAAGPVKMLVRLYFSDYEKLSHHRWVERIPREDPFHAAAPRIIHSTEADFNDVEKRFDELS